MEQGSSFWYAVRASAVKQFPLHSRNLLTSICLGTLADRSEEAVYRSAGVTSKSDAKTPEGEAVNLSKHKLYHQQD